MNDAATRKRLTEAELVRLVDEHQAGLWRYLRYLGCENGMAEDLVQEVFVHVWRHPFRRAGDAATASHLLTIARDRFLAECRRERARPAFGDLALADQVWSECAGEDDGDSYLAALRQCLARLSPRLQSILFLSYRDALSRSAIARQVNMAPDGVKAAMRQARSRLRNCVARRLR